MLSFDWSTPSLVHRCVPSALQDGGLVTILHKAHCRRHYFLGPIGCRNFYLPMVRLNLNTYPYHVSLCMVNMKCYTWPVIAKYAGHVRQTSSDVRQIAQTLPDILFNTHKPSHKENKNDHWYLPVINWEKCLDRGLKCTAEHQSSVGQFVRPVNFRDHWNTDLHSSVGHFHFLLFLWHICPSYCVGHFYSVG